MTGATGFIGRRCVARCLNAEYELKALVRPGREAALPDHPRLKPVAGDLDHPAALAALVTGAGTILHVAGAVRGRNQAEFIQTNINGTRRLTDAVAREAPAAHLIYVSSLAARHPELSWYAASKRAAEEVIPARHSQWSVLRPPVVYGRDDPALAPLWRWLARGWLLGPGSAHARFSLLHVDDLCEALVRLVSAGPANTVLELHDGREGGYDHAALVDIAARRLGRRPRIIRVPPTILGVLSVLNQASAPMRCTAPLLVPGKARELAHPDWVCDNAALTGVLGWAPLTRLEKCLHTLPGWNGKS